MVFVKLMDKILPTPPPKRFKSPDEMTSKDYVASLILFTVLEILLLGFIYCLGLGLFKIFKVFINVPFTVNELFMCLKTSPTKTILIFAFIAILIYCLWVCTTATFEFLKIIIADIKMLKHRNHKEG